MFFSGNSGKRYEGAEVKHEIYFERPYMRITLNFSLQCGSDLNNNQADLWESNINVSISLFQLWSLWSSCSISPYRVRKLIIWEIDVGHLCTADSIPNVYLKCQICLHWQHFTYLIAVSCALKLKKKQFWNISGARRGMSFF